MIIWGRVGMSVAFAAIFCIVATHTLQSASYYETYRWHICLGLLGAGAVLWPLGMVLHARAARLRIAAQGPQHPLNVGEDEGNNQPAMFSLSYWGLLLVIFSIIIVFITPQPASGVTTVSARPAPARKPEQPRTSPPEIKKTVTFPALKLQGLIHGQPKASALIDGRTYFVGDYIGEVKLVSIEGAQAVLELGGETKILVLDK